MERSGKIAVLFGRAKHENERRRNRCILVLVALVVGFSIATCQGKLCCIWITWRGFLRKTPARDYHSTGPARTWLPCEPPDFCCCAQLESIGGYPRPWEA